MNFGIQFGNAKLQVASIRATTQQGIAWVDFTNGTHATVGKKYFSTEDGVNYTPMFCFENGVMKDEFAPRPVNGQMVILPKNNVVDIKPLG